MKTSRKYRKGSITFFILTLLISWGAIWLIFGSEGIPATPELQQSIGMTILLGPALSGLLLITIYDGKGGWMSLVSRLLKWRIGVRWYGFALLLAPVSTLVGIFIFSFFSDIYLSPIAHSEDVTGLIMLGLVGGLFIGLFEELGWTGFAVPRLLKSYGIYTTGLLVGLVWGIWHFILFWEDDSFSATIPFLLLLARLLAWLPAYRILMVHVYQRTESLLIIVLMHASLVASLAILDPLVQDRELLIYILIRAAVLWGLVLGVSLFNIPENR